MSDYAVKKIDEMEAVFLGAFKRARAELGVESFGMQVIDMPANYENYPEHDHTHDNQEEVFLAMRGGGEIEIEGERFPLDPTTSPGSARGPSARSGRAPRGSAWSSSAAVPGAAYEAPDISKLGEPDPMAASYPRLALCFGASRPSGAPGARRSSPRRWRAPQTGAETETRSSSSPATSPSPAARPSTASTSPTATPRSPAK